MKWNHRWLTEKAETRKSGIAGIGTFTKAIILKDETIIVNGGVVVPNTERKEYVSIVGPYGSQISDDFWICPSTVDEVKKSGTINHSCEPNIGLSDSVSMKAMRDINENEELVTDYAFYESSFEPFTCNCGSKNCRKIIRPEDWKNAELQKKYGAYFSPYLREKF